MKILMKPIEMIAWFTKEGVPNPVRFKLDGMVSKVDQVTSKSEEKLGIGCLFTVARVRLTGS